MGTSIFTEMTELARSTGAVNLGQGVPELASPPALLKGVADAVLAGSNQYPRLMDSPRCARLSPLISCGGTASTTGRRGRYW